MNSEFKIEGLNKELKKLEAISEIMGSAIVKRNGILITSRLPRNIDNRKFGAMAATMFGAFESAVATLGNNKRINNLTVEFNNCQLVVLSAGRQIFVSLIDLNVNLGLILIEIEETIKKVQEYF